MTRRELIGCVVGGSLGFGVGLTAPGALLGYREVSLPVVLCPASTLGPAAIRAFPEHGVALVRTDSGLALISLTCTHLGCRLRLVGRELVCPCHDGRYDASGRVISGPPPRNLDWFSGGVDSQGMVYLLPNINDPQRQLITL